MKEEIIKEAQEHLKIVLDKDFKRILEFKIPKGRGVYLVKGKEGNNLFGNRIFYVGKSDNMFDRFKNHTNRNSNLKASTLKRKLSRDKGIYPMKVGDFLENECLIVLQQIDNFDMCHLVEALLIALLRKKGEPLLNNYKE